MHWSRQTTVDPKQLFEWGRIDPSVQPSMPTRPAVSPSWMRRLQALGWNYLYLSQKITDCDNNHDREVLLEAVANGSVISWRHINLLGEYDFSDGKLEDTVGIRPLKLAA